MIISMSSFKLDSGENHFDRTTPALSAPDGTDLHRFLGFFRENLWQSVAKEKRQTPTSNTKGEVTGHEPHRAICSDSGSPGSEQLTIT
jgi:hypothetical protein